MPRGHYTQHLDDLTIPMETPFWRKTHGRPAYITEHQARLITAIQDGYCGTQRELAAQTGYTIGGLNDALKSLRNLGAIVVLTTRGRLGRTIIRLRRGVRRLFSDVNVRITSRRGNRESNQRTERRPNISEKQLVERYGPGLQAFFDLRRTLFGTGG